MAIRVKVEDRSDEVTEEVAEAIKRALNRIGLQAVGYAQDMAPVDTGLLRNSITYAVAGNSPELASYKAERPDDTGVLHSGSYSGVAPAEPIGVYIGTNVEYGPYQEFSGNAFLKPAVAQHLGTYKAIIDDELKDVT